MTQTALQATPVKASSLMLREQDRTRLLALLAEHLPTITAWAYGSRVNGDAHEASDLDLVLRSSDLAPIPMDALINFKDALANSNIPIFVDARDWARLPTSFHDEILKNYVLLAKI